MNLVKQKWNVKKPLSKVYTCSKKWQQTTHAPNIYWSVNNSVLHLLLRKATQPSGKSPTLKTVGTSWKITSSIEINNRKKENSASEHVKYWNIQMNGKKVNISLKSAGFQINIDSWMHYSQRRSALGRRKIQWYGNLKDWEYRRFKCYLSSWIIKATYLIFLIFAHSNRHSW